MVAAGKAASVETAARAAVKATAATTMAATAVLSESGQRKASERERSECCQKSVLQGGLRHISYLHPNGDLAREGRHHDPTLF